MAVWRAGPAFPVTAPPGRSLPPWRDHFLSVRAEAAGAALPSAQGRGGACGERARAAGPSAAGPEAPAASAAASRSDALLGAAAPRGGRAGQRAARPRSILPPLRALRWDCPEAGVGPPAPRAPERSGLADRGLGGNMSVAFAAPRQRGKGEITPAAIQKVSRERLRDAGRGGVAWGRADAGFPTEPFGACSALTKAPATAARFPRGPGGLAPRGREGSGPEAPAPPRPAGTPLAEARTESAAPPTPRS